MGYVEDIILGAILSSSLPDDTKKKCCLAFNKLLWIQNDLFARWYVSDGEDLVPAAKTQKTPVTSNVNWNYVAVAALASVLAAASFVKS